jgi:cell division septal protein FtsQ
MSDNNVNLTFEERMRIQRVKKKKVLVIKLSCIIIAFLLLFVYFLIPFSHVSNSSVSGNKYYSKEQILTIANLNEGDSLYRISESDIETRLNASPLLGGQCDVTITPVGMWINVNELFPATYFDNEGKTYYFNNGNKIEENLLRNQDELVGGFLNSNLQKTVKLNFQPTTSNITRSNYKNIVSIVYKTDETKRQIIDQIGYDKTNNQMLVYVKGEQEKTYYKFVISLASTSTIEGAYKLFNLDLVSEAEKRISRGTTYVNEGENKVYSWEVNVSETQHNYEISLLEIRES